jgi:hypothetical protein
MDPELTRESIVTSPPSEIFQNPNILFHGINFDMTRFVGIMQDGILSEDAAKKQGKKVPRNSTGFNLSDTVSASLPPILSPDGTPGPSMQTYIQDSLSFVIDRETPVPLSVLNNNQLPERKPGLSDRSWDALRRSGFSDEVYVNGQVPLENISGIMVPIKYLDWRISRLDLGYRMMSTGQIDDRWKQTMRILEEQTGYNGSVNGLQEISAMRTQLAKSEGEYMRKWRRDTQLIGQIERIMQNHIGKGFSAKLGKDRVSVRDVLKAYVPSRIPIYSSTGQPLKV